MCNIQSINISIEPYGNISITAKFDNCSDLKNFETKSKSIFSFSSKLTFQLLIYSLMKQKIILTKLYLTNFK